MSVFTSVTAAVLAFSSVGVMPPPVTVFSDVQDSVTAQQRAVVAAEKREAEQLRLQREKVAAARSAERAALKKKAEARKKAERAAEQRKVEAKRKLVEKRKAAQSQSTSRAVGVQCTSSFYHEPQMTATGEQFNPNAMTAASKTLPLNSMLKVTGVRSGKTVVVRINDRGPYVGDRCLDLSAAAFAAIADPDAGVTEVILQPLKK